MITKNSKTLAALEQAQKYIPGLTQLLSKNPAQFSLGVWPIYFDRAAGVEVWDLDDNRYIDMSIGGIGATVLGYADPDVDRAVTEGILKGVSSSLNCYEEIKLAELLCELHPWAEKVRYVRTGGEAMSVAVRIARTATRKEKVAFCGYHGWHDWYLAANLGEGDALGGHLLPGLSPLGVPKSLAGTAYTFAYNQIDRLKEIVAKHGHELAAIVMEPIRNEQPQDNFLQEVRAIASQTGAVLIVDEISAGFRLRTGGAHMNFDLIPDIAVFAKAMGNGYPMGAIIGKADIMRAAEDSFISSTNWTERIGPVAAIATIKKFQQNDVSAHLQSIGQSVQDGWAEAAKHADLDIEVSGITPLSHFVFLKDHSLKKAFFVQEMLKKGFLASNQFYAMGAHSGKHVQSYLQAVKDVFKCMVSFDNQGVLEQKLEGRPASAGFKRLT